MPIYRIPDPSFVPKRSIPFYPLNESKSTKFQNAFVMNDQVLPNIQLQRTSAEKPTQKDDNLC